MDKLMEMHPTDEEVNSPFFCMHFHPSFHGREKVPALLGYEQTRECMARGRNWGTVQMAFLGESELYQYKHVVIHDDRGWAHLDRDGDEFVHYESSRRIRRDENIYELWRDGKLL